MVLAVVLSITTTYAQEGLIITLRTQGAFPTDGVVGASKVLYGDHTVQGPNIYSFKDAVEYNHDSYAVARACEIIRNGQLVSIERRAFTGTETGSSNDSFPLLTGALGNTWSGSNGSFNGDLYTLQVTVNGSITKAVRVKIEDTDSTGVAAQTIGSGTTTITYSFTVNPLDPPLSGTRNPNRLRVILSSDTLFTRPVLQLGSLQQTHEVGNSIIRWYPQHEEEVRHYEVQVWKDGMFRTEGKVPKAEKYSFKVLAEQPQQYRVVAVLLNRRKVYSDTILVQRMPSVATPGFVLVNPVQGRVMQFYFNADYGRSTIMLTSTMSGRRVASFRINASGTVRVPVLTPDTYTINVVTDAGTVFPPKQVIVQP